MDICSCYSEGRWAYPKYLQSPITNIESKEDITQIILVGDNSALEGVEALTGSWGYLLFLENMFYWSIYDRFFFDLTVISAITKEYLGDVFQAIPIEGEKHSLLSNLISLT